MAARSTAGLYDDPFFFDLDAFKGAVLGADNGRTLLRLGHRRLLPRPEPQRHRPARPELRSWAATGRAIGVWASTENASGTQLDQMGRPAINTVFNNVAMPQVRPRAVQRDSSPTSMVARGFRDHTEDVLMALGAADPAGLASVLIPDVMTYETGNMDGFLNGRRLPDDVIDAELALVTDGGITTDCVGNDSDLSERLAVPRTGESLSRTSVSASEALTRTGDRLATVPEPAGRGSADRSPRGSAALATFALPLAALLLVVGVQAWPQAAAPASAPVPAPAGEWHQFADRPHSGGPDRRRRRRRHDRHRSAHRVLARTPPARRRPRTRHGPTWATCTT